MDAASFQDWQALVELEEAAFSGDRISARRWRALLRSPSVTVTVALEASGRDSRIVGSTAILTADEFRRITRYGRRRQTAAVVISKEQ